MSLDDEARARTRRERMDESLKRGDQARPNIEDRLRRHPGAREGPPDLRLANDKIAL